MKEENGKVIVTGVNGFVGRHLARELNSAGYQVVGVGQDTAPETSIAGITEKYYQCDLTDPGSVSRIAIDGIVAVVNLAGLANVGQSFGQKERYMEINTSVHTVLYDRLANDGANVRILAISSGSVYDPNQPMPITEQGKILDEQNANPYTASKISMERSLEKYEDTSLDCVIVRPFNHIGPGQKTGFIVPDLADQIGQSKSTGSPVMVGNLDTKRDYTDVRDVARAYVDLISATKLNHNLYNVCSGKSLPGSFILSRLLEELDAKDLEIKTDQSKIRPNDIANIIGSYDRLNSDTGWKPSRSIEQTISDFAEQYIDDEQARLAA